VPEEVEIDTDKLSEDIKEEIERQGGTLLKAIALTTARSSPRSQQSQRCAPAAPLMRHWC
jgi:hypothetical protein